MLLHIDVKNKVANYRKRDGCIVCGNSDYQIKFTFDNEWDAATNKTARFIWGGQYTDVTFTGDTCNVPIITNTDSVEVGVYSGDLRTTTSAQITCQRSILCVAATPNFGSGLDGWGGDFIKAVSTKEEMDTILANAPNGYVDTFYMYLGPSTAEYTKGAVYKIREV